METVISQSCSIDIWRILFRSCAVMETWLVSLRPSCQMSNKCYKISRNKTICSKPSWTVSGCVHTKSNTAMKTSISHSFSTRPRYDTAVEVVDTCGNHFCSAQLFHITWQLPIRCLGNLTPTQHSWSRYVIYVTHSPYTFGWSIGLGVNAPSGR